MKTDYTSLFVETCAKRGNRALMMTYMYGKSLTHAEKDEMLTCSRIAKQRMQALKTK